MRLEGRPSRRRDRVDSDYEHLFHNRANPELLCIHSSQRPVPALAPGRTAAFVQHVYFVEGGIQECVLNEAFEADRPASDSKPIGPRSRRRPGAGGGT